MTELSLALLGSPVVLRDPCQQTFYRRQGCAVVRKPALTDIETIRRHLAHQLRALPDAVLLHQLQGKRRGHAGKNNVGGKKWDGGNSRRAFCDEHRNRLIMAHVA